ncbi:SGNH/GDSL hydrolase family protein [Methyloligella solikamskensis]|uniref:SGNH/GDSL hydrolase family protein n=1 Tax=Methyloligella solikamskensis TaxID=1177756 RepID=A0ABW3JB12_9HYPH
MKTILGFLSQAVVAVALTLVALELTSLAIAGMLSSLYGAPVLGGDTLTNRLRSTPYMQGTGPRYREIWNINGMGFRGPEWKFWSDARTVWVFGDSFTEGHGLAYDELYSSRLQKLLDERYGKGAWRVVSFGKGGTGLMLGLDIYEQGRKISPPDVVLYSGSANNEFLDAQRDLKEESKWTPLGGNLYFPYTEAISQRNADRANKLGWIGIVTSTATSFWQRFGQNETLEKEGAYLFTETDARDRLEEYPRFETLSLKIKEMARAGEIHTYFLMRRLDKPDQFVKFREEDRKVPDTAAYEQILAQFMSEVKEDAVPLTIATTLVGSFALNCDHCDEFRELGVEIPPDMIAKQDEERKVSATDRKFRDLWLDGVKSPDSDVCVLDLYDIFKPIANERLYQHYDGHIGARGHEAWAASVFALIEAKFEGRPLDGPGVACSTSGNMDDVLSVSSPSEP